MISMMDYDFPPVQRYFSRSRYTSGEIIAHHGNQTNHSHSSEAAACCFRTACPFRHSRTSSSDGSTTTSDSAAPNQ